MEEIRVRSTSHSYIVSIGEKILSQLEQFLTEDYSRVLIITDETVADLYLDIVKNNIPKEKISSHIIPAGEQSKNIDAFYNLHTEALKNGLDRNSLIVALGGGVVGDLAGFAAATYMRGIDYIQVPTTILAHDSSVGGKVAINHELGKNMIGNFYPPRAVVFDVTTLQSLKDKDIRSGYAELIKEALIDDEAFFHSMLKTELNTLSNKQLQEHIMFGIKVKALIVEADEKESGVRKYLNLGHTLGHAIEAELGYGTLTHGEAIAIGLLFALHVSEDIYGVSLPFNDLYQWLEKNDYPLNTFQFNEDALINKMKSDKKTIDNTIQMVLLEKIGTPATKEINDQDLKNYLQSFNQRVVRE
ncbi:3-dehydroquinate synthase [Virgibacillus indicus]|uniref:3-dehydroquinate synthase n=1 Tax=Virgibacillus indicus TaxID=2024554 RepID=A0A265NF79_9BACI|nr:3-dehydroquinate synthase [Virgibacillus indicus]OZU90114.1 3-dehydroquinate synthase [Virgibacillus indicus]